MKVRVSFGSGDSQVNIAISKVFWKELDMMDLKLVMLRPRNYPRMLAQNL